MLVESLRSEERPFASWQLHGLNQAPALLFSQIPSTNRWLRENASKCTPGTLVLANAQESGRGRFDRVWRSPEDRNLYMSLLLQPDNIPMLSWPHLTQVAAITLAQFYVELGVDAYVKWPNDILWNKHKMCGILSERTSRNAGFALVLGIGININSTEEDFTGLDRLAASLSMALGFRINREVFLSEFICRLQRSFDSFACTGIAPWLEAWRAMKNFVGSSARLVQMDKTTHGTIAGIMDDGSLLFTPEGLSEPIKVYSGDLEV